MSAEPPLDLGGIAARAQRVNDWAWGNDASPDAFDLSLDVPLLIAEIERLRIELKAAQYRRGNR